jgi:hypothetical protein
VRRQRFDQRDAAFRVNLSGPGEESSARWIRPERQPEILQQVTYPPDIHRLAPLQSPDRDRVSSRNSEA